MYTLIITIIAILLAVLLAGVSIYYGGSVWSQASNTATVAKVINEANQIDSAAKLYSVEQLGAPSSIQALVAGHYLRSTVSSNWELNGDYAAIVSTDQAQCDAINAKLGITTTPSCSDVTYEKRTVCCSTD